MRYRLTAILTVLLTLFTSGLAPAQEPQPVQKILYGIPEYLEAFHNKTPEDIASFLDKEGFRAVVNVPLSPEMIAALHTHGIKAYAEIKVFFGKEYWQRRPESRPIDAKGNAIAPEEWYYGVCASQEWLIEEKIREAAQIMDMFAVDGVWLDFMRWPSRWDTATPAPLKSCFCPNCLERFQKETGVTVPEDLRSVKEIAGWIYQNKAPEWYAWRSAVITGTAERIAAAVKQRKGNAMVGIFIVPWRNSDHDNGLSTIIGQDIAALSPSIDVFSPMVYQAILHKDASWINSVIAETRSLIDKPLWPIIHSDKEPLEEFSAAFKSATDSGASAVIVFLASAVQEKEKWRVLATLP